MYSQHPVVGRLRALCVGESILEPGKTVRQLKPHIARAKLGGRWFTAQSLTTGVRIQRYE